MMNYKFNVRSAHECDVEEIQAILYPHYFEESFYKHLDYDPQSCLKFIQSWLDHDCLVVEAEQKIIGVGALDYFKTYYVQEECVIEMFYIAPVFRGTNAGRMLLKNMIEIAETRNIGMIYASCASGIGQRNDKLYVNLFKKFDFEILGTDLIRHMCC